MTSRGASFVLWPRSQGPSNASSKGGTIEGRPVDTSCLVAIAFDEPERDEMVSRPLSDEITRVLQTACMRGSDLWHLPAAIYVTSEPGDLTFLTLDRRQGEVAAALGFRV